MPTSQNGYPANDRSVADTYTVPGSKVRLVLRRGAVAEVLLYVAKRFDNEVEDIDTAGSFKEDPVPDLPGAAGSKLADDWSYAERPVRGSTNTLSNHASATAIDLNATQHPLGVKGTFTAEQKARVRAILAHTADPVSGTPVVRWGEDYSTRPDGMHFEINASETAVKRVADILAGRTVRTLRAGMAGPDVAAVQAALQVGIDGDFGPGTEAAVRAFQKARNLSQDGEVGPITRAALFTPPKPPAAPKPSTPSQELTMADITAITTAVTKATAVAESARKEASASRTYALDARTGVTRLEAAVAALATALGPTVEASVRAALADAVIDVDVNVAGKVAE